MKAKLFNSPSKKQQIVCNFHTYAYYIERRSQDKVYGSSAANEFVAHAGSLFFTDRNLFNVYAKEMPITFRAIEKLISNGGATNINLYFNSDSKFGESLNE